MTANVTLLDSGAAHDTDLVDALTAIVNRAYAHGEAGMWLDGARRISHQEVRALVRAGELAVAHEDGRVVGCVRVAAIDDATAELGLLAVADDVRGGGVGRALVAFAEQIGRERGFTTMQLQLVVPREGSHPFKQRLDAWYRRLGYEVVRREDFASRFPQSARLLAGPCDFVIYERPLR